MSRAFLLLCIILSKSTHTHAHKKHKQKTKQKKKTKKKKKKKKKKKQKKKKKKKKKTNKKQTKKQKNNNKIREGNTVIKFEQDHISNISYWKAIKEGEIISYGLHEDKIKLIDGKYVFEYRKAVRSWSKL